MTESMTLTDVSKFLSFVLRHRPEAIGLTLDSEGWANIEVLIAGAIKEGWPLDRSLIQAVVDSSDKKRFAISADGRKIRAVQGHSTPTVSLSHAERVPPDYLYHGTATRFLASIRKRGLVTTGRHHVHLSRDAQAAEAVGRRYGKPVVLKIQAERMHHQGFKFFLAENGVWLTNHVPPQFIIE